MIIDPDRINEICETYETSMEFVKKCLNTLMTYPCVKESDEEYLYECLEILVSERSTQVFMRSNTPDTILRDNFFGSVEKCVYRIYGDDAIPYLSDKFLTNNDINERSM